MKTESNVWVEYSKQTGVLLLTVCLLAGFSVQGAEEWSWTGGGADNLWSTEANWEDSAGNPPADAPGDFSDEDSFIIGDGHAVLDGFATGGTHNNAESVIIGVGDGSEATLDVLSGQIKTYYDGEFSLGYDSDLSLEDFEGGTGTVNQTGGEVVAWDSDMNIGPRHTEVNGNWIVPEGEGHYNLSGGRFLVGGDGEIRIQAGSSLEISGGECDLRTGGTFHGAFRVVGSEAEIDFTGSGEEYSFRSTLAFLFDQDGVSPITATEDTTTLDFREGSELYVGWVDEPVYDTWTVADWNVEGSDTDLSFADGVDENIWSFEFVDTNESGQVDALEVTAIPEPSSVVLLGLAGLLLMKRRRV